MSEEHKSEIRADREALRRLSPEGTLDFLSNTRQEMYQALELFHNHVKYTISLLFSLLAGVFAIYSFSGHNLQRLGIDPVILNLLGAVILMLLFPLALVSVFIIARYYKLYVAALIYTADLHEAEGVGRHLWFEELEKDRQELEKDRQSQRMKNVNDAKQALVKRRTYGWPHSWVLYTILIVVLGVSGLLLGITLLTVYR